MNKYITPILRIIVAVILLQTLWFKFTAAPESVYIFTKVGMEPWGRIGLGILELIAGVLLLINRTAWVGALIALGIICGALYFHFTVLGIEVQDDNGTLFIMAMVVFLCSLVILWRERHKIPVSVTN